WTAVREGNGPGEMGSVVFIQRLASDSISVESNFSPRALLLDGAGNYVDELPTIPVGTADPDVLSRRSQIMLRMADGTGVGIIAQITRANVEGTATPSSIAEFHIVHRDGTSRLLG